MQLTKVTATGTKSKLTASDVVFGAEVNKQLLAQAVRVYQMNQRQGTSKTKTRSEVARTTAKWFKQKGTGRARHGARSAPLFVGGGVAHGPNGMQNWNRSLTKKMKVVALISALSAQAENIFVSEALGNLSGKTKEAAAMMSTMTTSKNKVLVILSNAKKEVSHSLRNLPKVLVSSASRLTTFEVAMADKIIMTTEAVKALEERLGGIAKAVVKEKAAKVESVKKQTKPAVPKKPAVKSVKKAAAK